MRFIILLSFFFSILFAHHGDVIRIGVLAKRGESITHKRWDATASYLNVKINSHQFVIVPLGFDELEEHVAEAKIDFVLTNTVYYVYLEQRYGISRIATLVNKNKQGQEMTQFGGVILTKANNSAINHLTDIKGKKFGAVDPLSFGGWIMAQYELEKVGIPEDEYKVSFFKSHDAVVKSVLNGTIDVGTVRSDTIERMHNEGKISLKDVKVINKQHIADFPYASSTRLYPEWPFARLPHASRDLSNKVLSALLQMPGDIPAAQNAYIAGWTIPLDYTIVHSVLQELHLPPYDKIPPITIEQIYQEHKLGVIIIVTLFIVAIFFVTYVNNLNSSLKKQQNTIVSLNQTLEAKVADRTEKIEKLLHDEKEQREIVDAILNSQDNIVILSDGEKLVTANHAMLEATGHTSLTSFLQDHHCIS